MRAACRRRKARRPRTGKTASRRCSARPISATTSTGRSSNRTAATPISRATSPTTRPRSTAAFATLVDVWGADHGGYVKRMQAAVAALSDGKVRLEVRLCQLVRLMRAGEPVKMSKRSGDFVTLREVVDEVGADAVRFMMLMRKNDAPLDFDLAKVIEQSQDNPVFYVQYAHARARSVLRQGKARLPRLRSDPRCSRPSRFFAARRRGRAGSHAHDGAISEARAAGGRSA